jgi:hypothetical protein
MLTEIAAADIDATRFHDEVVAGYRPAVLRGLVKDWPVVRAGLAGPEALATYLKRLDSGIRVVTKTAPPQVKGRFFYDPDITGFNYSKERMSVGKALDILLGLASEPSPPAFAIQSAQTRRYFPGFDAENRLPVLPDTVAPRIWIGNAVTVSAHYDPQENIACCAAGHRRFTLFPPDQARNLYPGPFELTPAGPIVSMVDFDEPDLDRYPGFSDAMTAALVVDLAPGDALYIPYLWWHHVRSLDPVSMLVNFWWKPPARTYEYGSEALLLAMMSIKNLPPGHRDAWRALFDHYVFEEHGAPGMHLPAARRGVQGEIDREEAARLRVNIARRLAPNLEEMPRIVTRLRGIARRLPWRR